MAQYLTAGRIPRTDLEAAGKLPPEVFYQPAYDAGRSEATGNPLAILPYYREVMANCGDGLVPLQRATHLAHSTALYVHGVTHGGMTEDPTVQGIVDSLLAGVVPASDSNPGCDSTPHAVP